MIGPFRYFVRALELVREAIGDLCMYAAHNGYSPLEPIASRKFFDIVIKAHAVEKGLALPHPRPLFGVDKIRRMRGALVDYDKDNSSFPLEMAKGALDEYAKFNLCQGVESADVISIIGDLPELTNSQSALTGGLRTVDAPSSDFFGSPESFLRSRRSCRTFANTKLDLDVVRRSVQLAQSAPSQCNRQSCKAHFYQGKSVIRHLLSLQGGATGFADGVENLFIVTSQITAWGGPEQRNQPFVDGGIFSLGLILALHAHGIANCPLNLATTNALERQIKSIAQIPSNERLIVMLAAGYTAEPRIRVAKSPRRPVAEILQIHRDPPNNIPAVTEPV